MRESLGGSLLFNLVIIFTSIVILVFVSIMAYSKAYRAKDRIIEIIEENGTYSTSTTYINDELKRIGYGTDNKKNCPRQNIVFYEDGMVRTMIISNLNTTTYNYCIYEIKKKSSENSKYYKVITYTTFRLPIIGDFIKFKVEGETKILGRKYNY